MAQMATISAIVQKVIEDGPHGPYVVATAEGIEGSITFSLSPEVWKEKVWPTEGDCVILSKFKKRRAGWRAMDSRLFNLSDQQKANSKEQKMNKFEIALAKWKSIFFPTETDKIWNEWVNLNPRRWKDLETLVKNPAIADKYKARAFYIMLTPNLEDCPFHWVDSDRLNGRVQSYIRYSSGWSEVFQNLSEKLLEYVCDLLVEFVPYAKERSSDSKFMDMLVNYNGMLVSLIGLAPSRALQLYLIFDINDPRSYANMDFSSGYNPYLALMSDRRITDNLKMAATNALHERINKEVFGGQKPREEWEKALFAYAYILESLCGRKPLPYGAWLLAMQLSFVIQIASQPKANPEGNRLISPWSVSRIMTILEGEEYLPLKKALARFVLTQNGSGYSVYSGDTIAGAELMLEALGADDPLYQGLLDQLLSSKQGLAEREHSRLRLESAENNLLAKMGQA